METWRKGFAAEELVQVLAWALMGGDGVLAGDRRRGLIPASGEEVAGKPLWAARQLVRSCCPGSSVPPRGQWEQQFPSLLARCWPHQSGNCFCYQCEEERERWQELKSVKCQPSYLL